MSGLDATVPPDEFVLAGIDASARPRFTVAEAAKVFFGKTPHWVRWRERNNFFVLDGKQVGTHRTPSNVRYYTLNDIEDIAHALAQRGAITVIELRAILVTVLGIARVYGYLRDPDADHIVSPDSE